MNSDLQSQYQARCRAILLQIQEHNHQRQIIQETSRFLQHQIQKYKNIILKEQHALESIKQQINLLSSLPPEHFEEDQDEDKLQRDKEQLARYQDQLVDEEKIINSTIVCLPEESLQKVASHFEAITEEKVIEMNQYEKETAEILQKIQKTKEKYEKIKDKMLNTKSQKKDSSAD